MLFIWVNKHSVQNFVPAWDAPIVFSAYFSVCERRSCYPFAPNLHRTITISRRVNIISNNICKSKTHESMNSTFVCLDSGGRNWVVHLFVLTELPNPYCAVFTPGTMQLKHAISVSFRFPPVTLQGSLAE